MKFRYRSKRNWGWGKEITYAVRNAYRYNSDPDRYPSMKTFMDKVSYLKSWCLETGVGDLAKGNPQLTLEEFASHVRSEVQDGEIAVGTAQNLISCANVAFELLSGTGGYWVSPSEYSGPRNYARTEPPDGLDRSTVDALICRLISEGLPRVAAGVALARYGGLRREEFCLADLDRWRRELRYGRIKVLEGTKGGVVPGRVIPVTMKLRQALELALQVRPYGSRNLLRPEERYKHFKHGDVQRARRILKEQGIKGYHELRAGYACERYATITGFPAPVLTGGRRIVDPEIDRFARLRVSTELGHRRIEITAAYYGKDNQPRYIARYIGGKRA